MKRKLLILLLVANTLLVCNKGWCQAQPDSTLVERYLLDFSVPDMPAFKSLGADPSNILRPSDVKKFAAMISPFYSNGKAAIPKNFALEVAPWKLASKRWTLSGYNDSAWKRFLYRSSFSLGAINDTTQFPSKLGIGYRVSFLSKRADIYRAAEIRNYIFQKQQEAGVAFTALNTYWVTNIVTPTPSVADRSTYYANHQDDFNEFLGNIEEYLDQNPNAVLRTLFDTFINSITTDPNHHYTSEELKDIIQVYGKSVDDYIEKYKRDNWNASRTDIAVSWVGESKDSLLSKARFSSFSVWFTQALRVHKGGQLLLGGNVSFPRSVNKDSARFNFNVNIRYYLGTQDFRGFLETQYLYRKYESDNKTLLLNLGAELRLGNSFWIIASAGVDNYLKQSNPVSKIVSGIDLRYGFNKPKP